MSSCDPASCQRPGGPPRLLRQRCSGRERCTYQQARGGGAAGLGRVQPPAGRPPRGAGGGRALVLPPSLRLGRRWPVSQRSVSFAHFLHVSVSSLFFADLGSFNHLRVCSLPASGVAPGPSSNQLQLRTTAGAAIDGLGLSISGSASGPMSSSVARSLGNGSARLRSKALPTHTHNGAPAGGGEGTDTSLHFLTAVILAVALSIHSVLEASRFRSLGNKRHDPMSSSQPSFYRFFSFK